MALMMLCQTAPANEMQLHVLNTGINLGWLNATIDSVGITPGNAGIITIWIEDAGLATGAIYNLMRAPFDIDSILKIQKSIGNFSTVTDNWSNRHKAKYLYSTYGMLRGQMSVIHKTYGGLRAKPTCDSYFADVGYHFGRAHIYSQFGNEPARRVAHEAMMTAISDGLRSSVRLGCGFGTEAEWFDLSMATVNTPAEYADALPVIQEIAASATGISDMDSEIPSSPPVIVPPVVKPPNPVIPPKKKPTSYGPNISGLWDNDNVVITLEGDKYIARRNNLSQAALNEGWRNGAPFLEIFGKTWQVNYVNQSVWKGRVLLKNNSGSFFWSDCDLTYGYSLPVNPRDPMEYSLTVSYGDAMMANFTLFRPSK